MNIIINTKTIINLIYNIKKYYIEYYSLPVIYTSRGPRTSILTQKRHENQFNEYEFRDKFSFTLIVLRSCAL